MIERKLEKNQAGLKIEKGDMIQIKAQGRIFSGMVLSANDYSNWNDAGWYIEFTGATGTYHYWKQGEDGGYIVGINGCAV